MLCRRARSVVTVAAMMAVTVTTVALRRLDGGNAQGGQNAGGQEKANTDKAHVTYSTLNAGRTLTAGPGTRKTSAGRVTHP